MGKKQHYVPQVYLRQFKIDDKNVFAFVKANKHLCPQRISDICQYSNFYKTLTYNNPDYIEDILFANDVEPKFKKVLDIFNDITKNIIDKNINMYDFTQEQRLEISRQIVFQYMRTPFYRKVIVNNQQNEIVQEISNFCASIGIIVEEIGLVKDEAAIHSVPLTDFEIVNELSEEIANEKWDILFSIVDFFTSDNPLIIIPIENMPVSDSVELKYFDKIIFPISPNILLRIKRSEKEENDNTVVIEKISSAKLKEINSLIFKNGKKYVFSKNMFNKLNINEIVELYG